MAKHYIGGHTILGRDSGWFSGVEARPIGDDAKPWVPKPVKVEKPVAAAKPSKKSAKANKAEIAAKADAARVSYIHTVLDAEFQNRQIPAPPKRVRDLLETMIERAGGAIKWARSQPEFDAIVKRKRAKYRAEPTPVKSDPPSAASAASFGTSALPPSTLFRILSDERSAVEMRRQAAIKLQRQCEARLSEIDAELKQLKGA